jgi:hypothetical protein
MLFDPKLYLGITGPRTQTQPYCTISKSGKFTLNQAAIKLMGLEFKNQKIGIGYSQGLYLLLPSDAKGGCFMWRAGKGKDTGLHCQAAALVNVCKEKLDWPFNEGQKSSVRYRVEKAKAKNGDVIVYNLV